MPEVRFRGPWKNWGKKTPPTKQGLGTRRSESGVVKRSVPRTARGESRVTATSGTHEARVLVVEKGVGWQKSVWTHPDSRDHSESQDELQKRELAGRKPRFSDEIDVGTER